MHFNVSLFFTAQVHDVRSTRSTLHMNIKHVRSTVHLLQSGLLTAIVTEIEVLLSYNNCKAKLCYLMLVCPKKKREETDEKIIKNSLPLPCHPVKLQIDFCTVLNLLNLRKQKIKKNKRVKLLDVASFLEIRKFSLPPFFN